MKSVGLEDKHPFSLAQSFLDACLLFHYPLFRSTGLLRHDTRVTRLSPRNLYISPFLVRVHSLEDTEINGGREIAHIILVLWISAI